VGGVTASRYWVVASYDLHIIRSACERRRSGDAVDLRCRPSADDGTAYDGERP